MAEFDNIIITEEEKTLIKAKSPGKLPLNPTSQGFSGQQIRAYLNDGAFGDSNSILAKLAEKLLAIKTHFDEIRADITTNDDKILILEDDMVAAEQAILSLANRVTITEQDITNLQGRMVTAESDIDKIENGTTIVGKALRDSLGNVIKDSYVSAIYPTYNDTTDKFYIETYGVEDILFANNEVVLPKATTDKNGLMSKEDKTKLDNINIDVSNKLDKVWSNVVAQTTLNLTDEFVLNRGNQVYKTTLSTLLGSIIPTDIFIVVNELPEEGQPNKIYLAPKEDEGTQNGFDEYIWIDEDWEKLGSIDIDLSNYYTKTETEDLIEQNKGVFWAEYGVTTYQEVNDAYNANKLIFFFHESATNSNMLYKLLYKNLQNGQFYFLGMSSNVRHAYVALSVGDVWSTPSFTNYEAIGNKVTTISSTSTDNQYPTAKAVYTLGESKVDKNANITGATKTKITYDSKGLVTAGADLVESDIPTLEISKITGLQTALDNKEDKNSGLAVETWNTATKILALSDANKLFKCSHTTNQTLTIPIDATVPIGTMISFLLTGTNTVTFVGTSGVTLTSMDGLVELKTQFAMASLIKTDTNTWQLVGALE